MKLNTGFTLVEVLIAMIILAVGLLGLAGLQATSLRNNQSAYNRSVATQLAYDIADRMRANYTYAKKSTGNVYVTSTIPPTSSDTGCISTAGCSSVNMALNDLYEWNQSIINSLPSTTAKPAKGIITIAGNVFTVTINWDDNRDGYVDNKDPHFQMSFQL
jgi:type IV pilus assembly protein PilV